MIIKNNFKALDYAKKPNIDYSIDEFLSLDMFSPIIKKNYFNKYDLSIFKKKNLEHMYLEWEDHH